MSAVDPSLKGFFFCVPFFMLLCPGRRVVVTTTCMRQDQLPEQRAQTSLSSAKPCTHKKTFYATPPGPRQLTAFV